MHQRYRFRPSLESLEARWVPATIKYVSGVLNISNQTAPLTVTQTADNAFKVTDGAKTIGSFASVKTIIITGTNKPDADLVDIGKFTYTGSLIMSTGNGNDTVHLFGTRGSLKGNVSILTGYGNDTINIARRMSALTIGGNLQATDTAGKDTILLGNKVAGGGVLQVLGNTTLFGINKVFLSSMQPNVYGGNFTATLGPDQATVLFPHGPFYPPAVFGISIEQEDGPAGGYSGATTTVRGNFTVNGGNNDDGVLLGAMVIEKNLILDLKNAIATDPSDPPLPSPLTTGRLGNDVSLSAFASGATFINGNFNYFGGAAVDFLDMGNSVTRGSFTAFMGAGKNVIALDDPTAPFGPVPHTEIDGNLTVYSEGDLETAFVFPVLGPPGVGIQAFIGGNAAFYLGHGDSNIVFEDEGFVAGLGGQVDGKLIIRAGNGDNKLTFLDKNFGDSLSTIFRLDVIYGNGTNLVTLNNTGVTLTGLLAGGTGSNTLDVLDGTLAPDLVLVNF